MPFFGAGGNTTCLLLLFWVLILIGQLFVIRSLSAYFGKTQSEMGYCENQKFSCPLFRKTLPLLPQMLHLSSNLQLLTMLSQGQP